MHNSFLASNQRTIQPTGQQILYYGEHFVHYVQHPLRYIEQLLHYRRQVLHYGQQLLYYGEELVCYGEHLWYCRKQCLFCGQHFCCTCRVFANWFETRWKRYMSRAHCPWYNTLSAKVWRTWQKLQDLCLGEFSDVAMYWVRKPLTSSPAPPTRFWDVFFHLSKRNHYIIRTTFETYSTLPTIRCYHPKNVDVLRLEDLWILNLSIQVLHLLQPDGSSSSFRWYFFQPEDLWIRQSFREDIIKSRHEVFLSSRTVIVVRAVFLLNKCVVACVGICW